MHRDNYRKRIQHVDRGAEKVRAGQTNEKSSLEALPRSRGHRRPVRGTLRPLLSHDLLRRRRPLPDFLVQQQLQCVPRRQQERDRLPVKLGN